MPQRVRVLVLIAMSLVGTALAKPAPQPKRVLFVCTGNYYRSRFAESVFNAAASPRWRAFSRGLNTSEPRTVPVSPLVIAELARRQIAISDGERFPMQLTQADIDAAELIVLLDRSEHEARFRKQFPSVPQRKLRAWDVADVQALAAAQAFAVLGEHVLDLERELRGSYKR